MPLKYKPLIPLLEGEQLDYTNQARIEDDVLANGISYFNASTSLFGTENEASCKVTNVAKAKSCYELTSKGANSDDPMTCGVLVLKNVESSTINITKCIAGRYECRVLLPKENGTTFCIKLLGQYGNQDYAFIQMQTPYEITNSEADINNCIEISAKVRNGTSKHKEVQITKNLNDGNFHTLGFDWYCSTNNKKINFYIDNTFIGSIDGDNVPNTPMKLYIGAYPSNNLPLSNYFDTDYVLIDYIRYIPFVNQEGITEVALVEDTKVGEITLTSTRDYPRIINTKNSNNELQVVSTFKKDSTGKIVSKLNTNGNNWTLDTNGNRNGYSYGNNSNSLDNKLIIPTSVDATIDNKKANYPVIQNNARARLKSITGNSIVWNQLCPNFKETINGKLRQCWYRDGGDMTITEENGELIATLMASDPTGVTFRLRPYTARANSDLDLMRNLPTRYHKVLFKFDARAEGTDTYDWGNWVLYLNGYYDNNPRFPNTMKSGEWTTFTYIQEMTLGDMVSCFFNPTDTLPAGVTGKNIGYSMRRVMVFDLTLMFGKGNEPTIEEFNRLFPNTYYPWVAEGELKKTTINSIKSYDKDGTELDSIDKLTNIDLISATTNSKYHQSIEVSNNINLSAYTYDGAETYTINKISNVSDKDLGKFNFTLSSTTGVSPIWWSVWDSTMNTDAAALSYDKISPILSNKYSSSRPHDTQFESTYNKFISFGGNAGQIFISDNSITTDMKLYLNNIKGKTMKYTQLINPANYRDTQTISGVTFTVNKTTGEILVNGTATEDIKYTVNAIREGTFIPTAMILLKGCPSGGSDSTYYLRWTNIGMNDTGSGNYAKLTKYGVFTDTINIWLGITIIIKSGTVMNNKRFYPQLFNVSDMYGLGKEPKTIADFNKDFPHSFYPYSNRSIKSVAIKQLSIKPGYKNLLDKTKFVATTTKNGITFTNNGDGTYTLNGTATATVWFHITGIDVLQGRKYLLQGCPSGGSESTYKLYVATDPVFGGIFDYGSGNIKQCLQDGHVAITMEVASGYTCNNVIFKPQIVDLTLTYGVGNEPTTVEQFNQDFPNIDDIPYAEQKITFASPIILNGINTAQDILKIVKDNYQYSLVKEEHIGSVDMGSLSWKIGAGATEDKMWYAGKYPDQMEINPYSSIPNMLTEKYITLMPSNVSDAVYNKSISKTGSKNDFVIIRDTTYTTAADLQTALNGQILYYAKRTPVTTTLYSLTPSNVAALFAKGYYIEVVGNDTNKDIIRPDVTVNIPCLNGTSYIDKEITFTNLDKEAIDGKMTGLTYHKKTIFRKELQGIHAYYGAKNTTTTELYSGLSFEDISLQIAEGGYIEVDYTGVQPNVSFDFPVQLYKIYEASYGKVDVVALDSQLQNAKYNTSLQLNNVKGRTVKWTQLVKTSLFKDTQTISGVTFTFNKTNGTITVNGTATEDITFSIMRSDGALNSSWTPADYAYMRGCPTGGSESTYYLRWGNTNMKDTGNGIYAKPSKSATQIKDTTVVYTGLQIIIKSGVTMTNKVFRPQLFNVSNIYGLGKEPKTIADFNKDYPYNIYPYGKQEILTTKVSGIKIRAGYKNWIDKNDLRTDNVTINGVTLKNNGDGTFTLNGTATADVIFGIYKGGVDAWKKMTSVNTNNIKLLYQGCPKGGSLNTYYTMNYFGYKDIGNGVIVTVGPNTATNLKLNTAMSINVKQGTTCNNLVFKPQIINLTDTYGEGNEPTTVAQFNQDFPDIDNIPYPEQTISFAEQTLYGINTAQDTLQVVKENDGYKLDLIHNITSIDMGDMNYYEWIYHGNNLGWVVYNTGNPFYTSSSLSKLPSDLITKDFITAPRVNIDVNNYNKTMCMADGTMYLINKNVTTGAEFKESVKGQILYGAARTPTTTTLATLTKNQVSALFAKGYCVEILGNDDNKIIVRPDVTIKYKGEVEETIAQSDDTDSEVVE